METTVSNDGRDAARRGALVDAAATVFLECGYAAATTDAIARGAGMSKKTLYRLFDSKIDLFAAVIRSRFFEIDVPDEPVGGDPAGSLSRLLAAMADILLRPDRLALIRLIVADGRVAPELNTAFQRLKVDSDANALERWLNRHAAAGLIRVENAACAAKLIFGMVLAQPMLNGLVDASGCCGEAPIGMRIDFAVRVFLREFAVPAS